MKRRRDDFERKNGLGWFDVVVVVGFIVFVGSCWFFVIWAAQSYFGD